MALCFLNPILVLLVYITLAHAAFSLSSDVAKFIPACAQECFESFLDANYDESKGGSVPSLQFLCSTKSISGNTAGEGAVACIESEDNAKFCTGDDAAETVVAEAFDMCSGLPNALPNTRGVITATLVLGGSGVVLISPGTTSGSLSHTSSSIATTTSRATTTLNSATRSPSLTSTAVTNSVTALPPTQKTSQNSGLSKNQIVGISVAGVGGAGIAIAAMIVVICLRKRRLARQGRDASSFYTNLSPSLSWGGKSTPPEVPARFDISPPNMFSRRSIPDNIGLAVSPDNSNPLVRRASRLLPDKPTLRLVVPAELPASNEVPASAELPGSEPDQMSRRQIQSMQSNFTQFEEDGRISQDMAGPNLRGSDQAISTTIDAFPSVPVSKYYIAPQPAPKDAFNSTNNAQYMYQNPNTDTALGPGPNLYVKPLNIDRSGRGNVLGPSPNPQMPPQQRGLEVPNTLRPVTQASSVYSQPTPYNGGAPFHNAPSTRQPSLNIWEGNKQQPSGLISYQQVGPYDRSSMSSLTSFESEASQGKKDRSNIRTSYRKSVVELSPVAGSPVSGKSPVSYPSIPSPSPVRLTANTVEMVPPPPQPNFGSVFWGRPQPNVDLSSRPWLAAETAAQRERNQRRDDLRLSRATRPSPQVAKRGLLPAAQIRERGSPPPPMPRDIANQRMQYAQPDEFYLQVPQKSRAGGMPPHPRTQMQPQGPQYVQPQRQQYEPYQGHQYPQSQERKPHRKSQLQPSSQPQGPPLPPKQATNMRPGAFIPCHSRSSSTHSVNSASSSLLAKRLGAEKAAGLQLITKVDSREKSRPGWRVLRQDEIEAAKDPGWKPQLLQQAQDEKSNNGGSGTSSYMGPENRGALLSPKSVRFTIERDGDSTPPPVTPGWMPKLTPTRKGDKLFLSVQ